MQPFLPCDCYAYHEFTKFAPVRNVMLPNYGPDIEAFGELIDQHPSIKEIIAQKLQSAVKISDFVSLRQFHRTDIHHYLFRPENLNYQLSFIAQDPNLQLGLALNRCHGDFTEEERQMLDLIRPHVLRAFHNSRVYSELSRDDEHENRATLLVTQSGKIRFITERAKQYLEQYAGVIAGDLLPETLRSWLKGRVLDPQGMCISELELRTASGKLTIKSLSPILDEEQHLVLYQQLEQNDLEKLRQLGLTPREAEVLFWVSKGKRNSEIGVILSAKSGTITKHLERIFAKLGVETRTSAANIALGVMARSHASP